MNCAAFFARPWTWQNSRSAPGRRVEAQPAADVYGQPDPPVGGSGQRQGGRRHSQPVQLDPAAVQGVVEGVVPAPVLGCQRHGRV